MAKTVAEKMGLKAGGRAFFHDAPAAVPAAMDLPELTVSRSLRGDFAYLHLFVTSQAGMERAFPRLARHLAPGGTLWVSRPKAGQLDTDLALPSVIRIGYRHGLVESTTLSVDAIWSAITFTHPKPGKQYRNSSGQLPDTADGA